MSPVIEVRQLHERYGGTVAVDDISFAVAEGEIFGILGPNGAGKTTTVECIATPLGAAVPALTAATQGSCPTALQPLTMAGWAVAFGLAAARFFRWE